MTIMLEKSTADLKAERERVLAEVSASEEELRERASDWRLTALEARVLRRLDSIDFLLSDEA